MPLAATAEAPFIGPYTSIKYSADAMKMDKFPVEQSQIDSDKPSWPLLTPCERNTSKDW